MKNLFLLGSFLFFGIAYGQQYITQVSYPDDVVKTIVREYNYPSTISYVETASDHYFSYADASMTVVSVSIGTDVSVSDFVIYGDYVYICGVEHSGTTKGILGWFRANDLTSGTLTLNTWDTYECANYNLDSLYSLVTYYTLRDSVYIALVGSASDGVSRRACMMEIVGVEGNTNGWRYRLGISSNEGEHLEHICLTDNLVIGAGVTSDECCSETYRVHWRWNMFATGGPQDVINAFNGSSSHYYDHAWGNFAMTHTGGDTIAVATFYGTASAVKEEVMLNTYNMYDVALGLYTTSDYSALLIPSSNLSKCTIQGLRYSGLTKTYSLLLSGDFPAFGVGSHYVEFDPNSAFATVSSLKDVSLSSIDTYNSGTSFVSLGSDMVTPSNAIFHTQPFLSSGLCLQKNTIYVQDDIFARKHSENPYTVCVDTFDCARRVYKNKKELENRTVCSD